MGTRRSSVAAGDPSVADTARPGTAAREASVVTMSAPTSSVKYGRRETEAEKRAKSSRQVGPVVCALVAALGIENGNVALSIETARTATPSSTTAGGVHARCVALMIRAGAV
jgi:hypothetical protein